MFNNLKTGDIVLYRRLFKIYKPISWITFLIRFFAKSKYNHASILISNWNTIFANEAISKGIVSRPFEERIRIEKSNQRIKIIRPIDIIINEKEFATKAMSKVGTPYDYWSLLFYHLLYQISGVWIGKKKNAATNEFFCYEYVAWCYDMNEFWKADPLDFEDENKYITIYEDKI